MSTQSAISPISRQRLHQVRFPERQKARQAVAEAVKSGKLPRPSELRCTDCDRYAQEYDHYLGYAPEHRLDVQPVCIKCHKKRPQMARINKKRPKVRVIPQEERRTPMVTELSNLKLTCLRCGTTWFRRVDHPKLCPSCHSPYWDKPKVKAQPARGE